MSEKVIKAIFKIKRGTYNELKDYVPQPGEPVYEIDTNQLKMGGLDNLPYSELPYLLSECDELIKRIEEIGKSAEETKIVLKDFNELKSNCEEIRRFAIEEDEYEIITMIEDNLKEFNKSIWFINSSLKS